MPRASAFRRRCGQRWPGMATRESRPSFRSGPWSDSPCPRNAGSARPRPPHSPESRLDALHGSGDGEAQLRGPDGEESMPAAA
eukprot:7896355-Lingulodinium_polyedra.AAC.1